MPSIGKKIQKYRIRKGLTQDTLAEAAHVSRQTISTYESDKIEPSAITLADLANALDVTPNDILVDYMAAPKAPTADTQKILDQVEGLGASEMGFIQELLKSVRQLIRFCSPHVDDESYEEEYT